MTLQAQRARFSDGPAIARAYISAFFNDPYNKALFPGVSFQSLVDGFISRWPRNYSRDTSCYIIITDTSVSEVVSFSKWSLSDTDPSISFESIDGIEAKSEQPLDLTDASSVLQYSTSPAGLNEEFACEQHLRFQEIRLHSIGRQPRLELQLMGTIPSYRRRGAGTLHVKWGTEVADKLGLPCWVEASPASTALCKRFGFEEKGKLITDLRNWGGNADYTHTCMMRSP